MKKCLKCLIIKEINEFGKDKQRTSGIYGYCKECVKNRSKKQRENDPGYYEEYAKTYRQKNRQILREKAAKDYTENREKRLLQGAKSYLKNKGKIALKRVAKRRLPEEIEKNRERVREWSQNNRSKVLATVTKWKKANPEKANAHSLIVFALKTGLITRSDRCEECKEEKKLEGHHMDYSKPLDVIWLCKSCHAKKHRIYR